MLNVEKANDRILKSFFFKTELLFIEVKTITDNDRIFSQLGKQNLNSILAISWFETKFMWNNFVQCTENTHTSMNASHSDSKRNTTTLAKP